MDQEEDRECFLFEGDLPEIDDDADLVIGLEEERQNRKLIMIPSESVAPKAVRQALGSVFTNLYAEGYPPLKMTRDEMGMLLDFRQQCAYQRRYANRRFYKGCEHVDFIECLAQKRVAQLFATDRDPAARVRVRADEIFANVQPLSGAAANNAVYEAFLEAGDILMGMDLTHGGHLTHGSPYNRSGKYHRVVPYGVNPKTERLDYDEIRQLVLENRPRIIVAGASAYPWDIDWEKLREIADSVSALLMADIAHPAGLVVAGKFPNPIGYADVITFTTHKTLIGPRGAVILTTDQEKAKKIDRAVFPGEQGGPHINNIAAMAVAFKIAQTEKFRHLQEQTVENAQALAEGLQRRGLKLAYGGTNTHMLLIDLKGIQMASGFPLKGEIASRILDLCGIVCNKNTIPGDLNAAHSSALRLGTTWLTQRGLKREHMERIAELLYRVLSSIQTFRYFGLTGDVARGKIALEVMEEVRQGVAEVVGEAVCDVSLLTGNHRRPSPPPDTTLQGVKLSAALPHLDEAALLEISGERARAFLEEVATNRLSHMQPGQGQPSLLLDGEGKVIDEILIFRLEPLPNGCDRYLLATKAEKAAKVQRWLSSLSDGYITFDPDDIYAKIEGPVVIEGENPASLQLRQELDRALASLGPSSLQAASHDSLLDLSKPYFVGQRSIRAQVKPSADGKKEFRYVEASGPLRRTWLYQEHLQLTKERNIIPFAGWAMPVWYTSISDEHAAVRQTAGLFDVSHMGVLGIEGEHATRFLDLVTTNYVPGLAIGRSHYSYILDPDGNVMDDVFLYRLALGRYMMVVNAINAEKILAWLEAVNSGQYIIDRDNPAAMVDGSVTIRDLKATTSGEARRVDIALQGPNSLAILQAATEDEHLRRRLDRLQRTEVAQGEVGGIGLIISRTGYTGEAMGFELYVHPDDAPALWRWLLEKGKEHGLKPAGLGARDSTRTEAGLPLYGHELAGEHHISPTGAGYGAFVKLHKPFFVGRRAFLEKEAQRKQEVIRFRMNNRGIRMVRPGNPVMNRRGEYIGAVTSCVLADGVQVGMAYVDRRYTQEGTPIAIFILPERVPPEKPKTELALGDRVLLHEEATVLPRFMVPKARPNGPRGSA